MFVYAYSFWGSSKPKSVVFYQMAVSCMRLNIFYKYWSNTGSIMWTFAQDQYYKSENKLHILKYFENQPLFWKNFPKYVCKLKKFG